MLELSIFFGVIVVAICVLSIVVPRTMRPKADRRGRNDIHSERDEESVTRN